jgi:hypothetical protein
VLFGSVAKVTASFRKKRPEVWYCHELLHFDGADAKPGGKKHPLSYIESLPAAAKRDQSPGRAGYEIVVKWNEGKIIVKC